MRMVMQFVEGIRRSMDREKLNPKEAADSLDEALARALDMDVDVLLRLAPESFATVAQISINEPRIAAYIVYTLALGAHYLRESGDAEAAQLRYEQACAFADAFGIDAPGPDDIPCEEDLDALVAEDGFDPEALASAGL